MTQCVARVFGRRKLQQQRLMPPCVGTKVTRRKGVMSRRPSAVMRATRLYRRAALRKSALREFNAHQDLQLLECKACA